MSRCCSLPRIEKKAEGAAVPPHVPPPMSASVGHAAFATLLRIVRLALFGPESARTLCAAFSFLFSVEDVLSAAVITTVIASVLSAK